jgi:hypothetical protein
MSLALQERAKLETAGEGNNRRLYRMTCSYMGQNPTRLNQVQAGIADGLELLLEGKSYLKIQFILQWSRPELLGQIKPEFIAKCFGKFLREPYGSALEHFHYCVEALEKNGPKLLAQVTTQLICDALTERGAPNYETAASIKNYVAPILQTLERINATPYTAAVNGAIDVFCPSLGVRFSIEMARLKGEEGPPLR